MLPQFGLKGPSCPIVFATFCFMWTWLEMDTLLYLRCLRPVREGPGLRAIFANDDDDYDDDDGGAISEDNRLTIDNP
jgi:hypothetical protein